MPWEDCLDTLRNAFVDAEVPNVLLSNCLHPSWICVNLPKDIIRKEVRRIQQRLQWGGDGQPEKALLREVLVWLDRNQYTE